MMSQPRTAAAPAAVFVACCVAQAAAAPVDVASCRQLFVDDLLIAERTNVRLVLHRPVRREVAIANDNPWEKYGVSYMVTFRDGDRFRAWYRCDGGPLDKARRVSTAYAESRDGVHWDKPKLGIVECDGSTDNNIVWLEKGMKNMAPFKGGNPAAPDDERYKAVIVASTDSGRGLLGMVSPDGLRWRLLQEQPILTERPFDSHNVAFWDDWRKEYVAYTRGVRTEGTPGWGASKRFKGGVRWIRRATSKDFRPWTPLEPILTRHAPIEHFYTNAAEPYERAPGLYLMFPSRFVNERQPQPDWKYGKGVSDIVLMTSRDGMRFERTFLEAFVRPGLDPGNWHERALYMERGILQTAPDELSMYAMENWRLDTVHIRRLTIRPDGFVSVQAPYAGGEFVTKPMRFTGCQLRINFSTSAAGSVHVEIQKPDGTPIVPFGIDECPPMFGDDLDCPVKWKSGEDVSALAGKPIRLRFAMKDADLYALRFSE